MTPHQYVRSFDNPYLKKEKDVHILRFIFTLFWMILPVLLLLLLLVHWHNQIYALGYRIDLLEHNRAKLEEKKMSLLLEKERLKRSSIMEDEARAEGYQPPDFSQVEVVREK